MPIYGPYKHRNRWRIVAVIGNAQTAQSYESEAAALRAKRKALALVEAQGTTVGALVEQYLESKRIGGVRPGTLATARYRLRGILELGQPDGEGRYEGRGADRTLADLTTSVAQSLYKTRSQATAGDTHLAELSLAVSAFDWAVGEGLARSNPFAEVEPVGRRRAGKKQLRVTEARALLDAALGEDSREGLAVALALLLGLRASEVTDRRVRDVDDDGRLLWVDEGTLKTENAARSFEIPAVLRERLVALTANREPDEHLWGNSRRGNPCNRHWLEHHTRRLSAAIGQSVCPQGLRGLHSTIATVNRVSAEAVAAALGHGGTKVTRRHYIARGAEAGTRAAELAERLGRKPKSRRRRK